MTETISSASVEGRKSELWTPPDSDTMIRVEKLSKEYRVYGNPYNRFLERLPGFGQRHQKVHALKDIDLRVRRGTTVGLVGENGAGKSTLLKILTGTTFPSSGRFRIEGKVASLLELGAGFHQDFTGRENIYLNAAMMGLTREETHERYHSIEEFSELGRFLDAPIRTYSSGMVARLGFSTAIAVDPDVLIIDEILAVGDMNFQRKCVEKMWSFKEQGKTILFCSHSLYDMRQLCDEAAWIHKGELRLFSDAVTVTNEYATYEKQLVGREADVLKNLPGEAAELGPKGPHIVDIEIVDPRTGEARYEVRPRCELRIRVRWANHGQEVPLSVGIGFTRTDATLCLGQTTELDGVRIEGSEGVVELDLHDLRLLSGEFVVFVWLMDGRGVHRYHQLLSSRNLVVLNDGKEPGLFLQDHSWNVRSGGDG